MTRAFGGLDSAGGIPDKLGVGGVDIGSSLGRVVQHLGVSCRQRSLEAVVV